MRVDLNDFMENDGRICESCWEGCCDNIVLLKHRFNFYKQIVTSINIKQSDTRLLSSKMHRKKMPHENSVTIILHKSGQSPN